MQTIGDAELKQLYVGSECENRFGIFRLSRPVENGIIVNWGDFESILRHHFISTLQVDITRHPVLISMGSRGYGQTDMANIVRLLLSKFKAPLVSIQPEWKLVSYAAKLETCLLVSLG